MRYPRSIVMLSLCAAWVAVFPAHAAYPEKPIRLIVSFSPGGTTDILARTLGSRLHASLGQPVVVDNRPGASGNIGTDIVAKSRPDGYTLLFALMNTHVVNQALYTNMPFDGVKDFTPIALLAYVVTTMVINPAVPAGNVRELIAYAKANPGKLAYASAGKGSSTHLNAAIFAKMAGIEMLHVPYKGGAPAVVATVSGQTQVLFTAATQTLPHVKSGRLKLLGVTRKERVALFPDVPAIAEMLPGYEALVWFGALGPAGMPKSLTMKLNAEINRIMNSSEVKKSMGDIGVEVANATPAEFLSIMRKDTVYWNKIVRELNIKAD